MKRIATTLPIALILAACGSAGDHSAIVATNASVDEVAQKVEKATAGGNFVSPGRWEGQVRIVDINIPGVPAAAADKMKAQMAKAQSFTNCLTPEEAKQPRGKFFGADQAGACTYNSFTMANGVIDAAMTCGEGATVRKMVMKGKYSPDSYDMTVSSTGEASAANPMAGMAMTMAMHATHAGACRGDEDGTKK